MKLGQQEGGEGHWRRGRIQSIHCMKSSVNRLQHRGEKRTHIRPYSFPRHKPTIFLEMSQEPLFIIMFNSTTPLCNLCHLHVYLTRLKSYPNDYQSLPIIPLSEAERESREMALQSRALAALPKDWRHSSQEPRLLTTTYLQLQLQGICCPLLASVHIALMCSYSHKALMLTLNQHK